MTSDSNDPAAGAVRRSVLVVGAAGLLALNARWVGAHTPYPSKPLKLIHAFAPGSSTDNTGRLIAQRLSERLGQPVIVENKPGANMIVGTEHAARQPADGHTLIMVTLDNIAINPVLYRNPGYAAKDFDALTLIGALPLVLTAAPAFKFNTLQELRSAASSTREPFSFATWGVGSVPHMYGELIKAETGIPLNFIPYQGGAPATNATLGGHVDLTLATAFTSVAHI